MSNKSNDGTQVGSLKKNGNSEASRKHARNLVARDSDDRLWASSRVSISNKINKKLKKEKS